MTRTPHLTGHSRVASGTCARLHQAGLTILGLVVHSSTHVHTTNPGNINVAR